MNIFGNIKITKDRIALEYIDDYPAFVNSIRRVLVHGDSIYVLNVKSMIESDNHPVFEETKLIFTHIYINNEALNGIDPTTIEFLIEYNNETSDEYHKLYSRDIIFKPSKNSDKFIRKDIYICTVSPGQKYSVSGSLSKINMPMVSNCAYDVDKKILEEDHKYKGTLVIFPLEIYSPRIILKQTLHIINEMVTNFVVSSEDEMIESNLTVLELITQHINRTRKSEVATYTMIHPLKSSYRFRYQGNINEVKKELLGKIKAAFDFINEYKENKLDQIYYY